MSGLLIDHLSASLGTGALSRPNCMFKSLIEFLVAAADFAELGRRLQLLREEWSRGGLDDEAMRFLEPLADSLRRHGPGRHLARRGTTFRSGRCARPKSPDRALSRVRRRKSGRDGWVPPCIHVEFSEGELAVLNVLAEACHRSRDGRCTWPMARIAALAGVCHRLAQMATQKARRLGLISWQDRPRKGARSDTNVIAITDPAWLEHIAGKAREAQTAKLKGAETGCKNLHTTKDIFISSVPATGQRREGRPDMAAEEAVRGLLKATTGVAGVVSPP